MEKNKRDSLSARMKQYEAVNDRILVPKMPFIIRVDGKNFSTYTRGFKKPFDKIMGKTMREVVAKLCEEIPGAVLGYTQSDEITIICKYTDRIISQAWFNGRVRKIETIAASKATKWFNKLFTENLENYEIEIRQKISLYKEASDIDKDAYRKYDTVLRKKAGMAEFDARVFNVPEWDCINNIIWRQQDAIRNSVEMVGHANFSTKELHKVNCEGIKKMLKEQQGIDWEKDFNSYQKYGAFCYRVETQREIKGKTITRNEWYCNKYEEFIVQEDRNRFAVLTGLIED